MLTNFDFRRYVTIGNHRDAWTFGSIDPSSATACMMEMVRVMGELVQGGWRPRRTIIFQSWGSGEHGYLGANEWVDEYQKVMAHRIVAHINVDIAVTHSYNLLGAATPLMQTLMAEATKRIPAPKPELGYKTLFEHWSGERRYTGEKLVDTNLGSVSDHAVLYQRLGVPTAYFSWMPDPSKWEGADYPLYHTAFETFDAVKQHLDPDFAHHRAIAHLWGVIALELAGARALTEVMDLAKVAEILREGIDDLEREHGAFFKEHGISLLNLRLRTELFALEAAKYSERASDQIERADPLTLRMLNDQLVGVEKAFIDVNGLPRRPWQKNVIFGTSVDDEYSSAMFPGVREALHGVKVIRGGEELARRIEEAKQQLSVCAFAVNSATITIRDLKHF